MGRKYSDYRILNNTDYLCSHRMHNDTTRQRAILPYLAMVIGECQNWTFFIC